MKKVFRTHDYFAFALITFCCGAITLYAMSAWFDSENWSTHPFTFWLLTCVFVGKLLIHQSRWWILPFMAKPIAVPAKHGLRVGVATTFVPGVESIQMLEESVAAMVAMDYPHDTWVLDEEDDPEVRELCDRLGAEHFSRKGFPDYQTNSGKYRKKTKHGNYNSWLTEIGFQRYEIITNFDPDHVPAENFLHEVLGFFEGPDVGYVQAAQAYYNQHASFIARGAAEETYSYYSATQMFCYAMGYPIVTGCHTTHRSSALQEVGGMADHDADDLLITLHYRTAGWRGVYVPKILARGLTPVDWEGYFTQQLRWARSVLDIKFRVYPRMAGKLPMREVAVSFLHGFYYLQGISTLIIFILLAYVLAAGPASGVGNYFISLPFASMLAVLFLLDLYHQLFYLDRANEAGIHWRARLLQFAKYPYLVFALFDVVLNRRRPYTITNKATPGRRSLTTFLPHLAVAGLICAGWAIGRLNGHDLPIVIQLAAGVAVMWTMALAATSLRTFPAPYEPGQLRKG